MVYLTSEDFIKATTNISDNMQGKFMGPAMREAQQIDLQNIIGTLMLDKLQGLVSGGTINSAENAAYKGLLEECQYFLAYSVIVKLILISAVKIDNIGPNATGDERVTNLSLDETFNLQKTYQDKADWYAYLLQKYILEHRDELPEITECQCGEISANLRSAASGGLWLGGKRSRIDPSRTCGKRCR